MTDGARRKGVATEARSVRLSNEVWFKARSRAEHEGTTVSYVIQSLLEGYSSGMLNLPKVTKTY